MDNLKNLVQYYTECIEIESLSEFSFPSFKKDENFILPQLESEWSSSEETLQQDLSQAIRRGLALERQSSSLYYGWPTYVIPKISARGKPYYWFQPFFLLKIETSELNDSFEMNLLREWPQINNKVLKEFASSKEERTQIIDTLGLSEAESIPKEGLITFWQKFLKLYPNTNELTPKIYQFSEFDKKGFYNLPMIIVAKTPVYSQKLLKELRLLQQSEHLNNAKNTSINSLLQNNPSRTKFDFNPGLITPLNRSQRLSLSRAFTNPISVITGPPGTGKSQVVLNLIVNAFENNQTVLFTSKNNKAVDVVCERILNSIDFPINLRLGTKNENRDYTTEFLDLLDKVLSGADRDTVLSNYTKSKENYESAKNKYYHFLGLFDDIVSTRNKINDLDKELEKFESRIDSTLIEKIKLLEFKDSSYIELTVQELNQFYKNDIPFTYKLFGFFSKKYPHKKLHYYLSEYNSSIENLLPLKDDVDTDLNYYESFFSKFLNVYNFHKIYTDIQSLRNHKHLNALHDMSSFITQLETDFIDATKNYIESLGRYRITELTNDERKALTNYYSAVRSLSGEYPGDRAWAKLKQQQEKLFPIVISILPIWSVTNLSVGGHIPFVPNIFDLLIIDESSQSDIASALPLFYRSSNAVIIGDPQQLKNISSVRKAQDTRLMEKYNLLEEDNLRFSYSIQSLYHCARGVVSSDSVTLLNEHYRSHYSIIEFSNRSWYDGNLDIRTNYSNLFYPPEGYSNLMWFHYIGETIRPDGKSALNKKEAEEVLNLLSELISLYESTKPSIGIVTPFRAQADYLKARIIESYDERFINSYLLITDVAHKFQGDERDIVIFSPVISSTKVNDSTLIGFLQSTSNIFNVSITRARSMLFVVGDKIKCINSGISYLKSFVEYIEQKQYEKLDMPHSGFESPWEKRLYEALVSEGFSPKIQYQAGPYFIDLVILNDNVKIAIEVDGEQWHTDLTGDRLERDIIRDRNIEKMGFTVVRFWTHDLKYDLANCIAKITSFVLKVD